MKRRRRFGVGPLVFLSLVVCILTAILWARSYRVMDELFVIYKGDGSEELSCLRGEIRIKHTWPMSAEREGLARISHRSNRVAALPPRPWNENRLRRKWLLFRYDDSYAGPVPPPPRPNPILLKQSQDAVAAYRALLLDAARNPTTNPTDPRQIALAQKLNAARVALLQSSLPTSPFRPYESYRAVTFPLWLLMLPVLGPAAGWAVSKLRRRRRTRSNRCPACGYNLTGNTSGICPECGETVLICETAKG